jgi:hypothetical protein
LLERSVEITLCARRAPTSCERSTSRLVLLEWKIMRNLHLLAAMLTRELLTRDKLTRQPEPTALMEDSDSVEAFHQQGASAGPLAPVYEFNAWATSQLVPENGTVIDLGSGSGQYLAYLARYSNSWLRSIASHGHTRTAFPCSTQVW